MLLRFEVANHRSIDTPVELSLIAVDDDRPAARSFDSLDERVLAVAGIYGPNASGKSNVLDALFWLSSAVASSLRDWDTFVPRDPFRFGRGPSNTSSYEVDLVLDGTRFTYRLETNDTEVQFEGLYSYPRRKRRTLFERAGLDLQFRRGSAPSAGTRELLTPTTLALSAAMRLGEPEVEHVGRTLAGFHARGLGQRDRWSAGRPSMASTARLFGDLRDQSSLFDDGYDDPDRSLSRESALTLLRYADLGIEDVRVERSVTDSTLRGEPLRRTTIQFVHRIGGQELLFGANQESDGTQMWFSLIGPVLAALRRGQVLLFDEIDASLHPRLSARLVELFQDPETNPRGAQLIFTSHDTSLLNHLNRDEVWLTERGGDGATSLTALAEYGGDKVRRSLNLEKAYLQGRFGAVPEVDQHVLRQALGLAVDS